MKRRIKNYVSIGVLLASMISLYGLALANSRNFSDRSASYMFYKKSNYLTGKEASNLQYQNDERERPFAFTLWGTEKKQKVSILDYDKKADAQVYLICGSSDLLFPRDAVLDEEDQQSCLLSEDLAYQLFGSKDVVGLNIAYQGQEYRIKGILKEAKKTLVIQADQRTEAIMDAAALAVPKDRLSSLEAADFKQLYGDADMELNLNAVTGWGRFFVNLLPLCMIGVLMWRAVKKTVAWRQTPVKCFALAVASVLLITCCLLLNDWKTGLSFPFAPSQWSDFSYWGETMKGLQEQLRVFIIIEKRTPEMMIVENVLTTVKYMVLGIFIFIWRIRKLEPSTGIEVLIYCVVSICSVFVAVLYLMEGSHSIGLASSLWLLPSSFILGTYLLGKIKSPENCASLTTQEYSKGYVK